MGAPVQTLADPLGYRADIHEAFLKLACCLISDLPAHAKREGGSNPNDDPRDGFDDIERAFRLMQTKEEGVIKPLIRFG